MAPEAPRLDDTPSRKRVKITEAERRMLKVADTNSPEVQAFLELNGLKFGDQIIADVEGRDEPEVFDLTEKDFFDTIHEDAEALSGGEEVPEVVRDELADASFDLVGPEDPEEKPVVNLELAVAPGDVAREIVDGSDHVAPMNEELQRLEYYYSGRAADVVVFTQNESEERIESLITRSKEVDATIDRLQELMAQAGELYKVGWGIEHEASGKGRAQATLDEIAGKLREIHTALQQAGEIDAADAEGDINKLKALLDEKTKELQREDETAELVVRDKLQAKPELAESVQPKVSSKETQALFTSAIKELEANSGIAHATGEKLTLKAKELLEVILAIEEMALHARFGSLIPERIYQLEATLKEIADPETTPSKLKDDAEAQAALVRKAIIDAGALWDMKLDERV